MTGFSPSITPLTKRAHDKFKANMALLAYANGGHLKGAIKTHTFKAREALPSEAGLTLLDLKEKILSTKRNDSLINFLFFSRILGFRLFGNKSEAIMNHPLNKELKVFTQKLKEKIGKEVDVKQLNLGKDLRAAKDVEDMITRLVKRVNFMPDDFQVHFEKALRDLIETCPTVNLAKERLKGGSPDKATLYPVVEDLFFQVVKTLHGMERPRIFKSDDFGRALWISESAIKEEQWQSLQNWSCFVPHVAVWLAGKDTQGVNLPPEEAEKLKADNIGLTTINNNALQWLYNKGLEYFVNASPEEISDKYGCPEWIAREIHRIAKAVGIDETLFGKYDQYRMMVGGKLDSWTSNYLDRLLELKNLLSCIETIHVPEGIIRLHREQPDHAVFNGLQYPAGTLLDMVMTHDSECVRARKIIDTLLFMRPASVDEVIENLMWLDAFIDAHNALMRAVIQLNNQLSQHGFEEIMLYCIELDKKGEKQVRPAGADELKTLSKLPVLNKLNIGEPDYERELESGARALEALLREMKALEKRLAEEGLLSESLFDAIKRREQSILNEMSESQARRFDIDELAVRRLASMVIPRVRTLSSDLKAKAQAWLMEETDLFWEPVPGGFRKHRNDIHNLLNLSQGTLYKHPRSTARHKPLYLNIHANVEQEIENFVKYMERIVEQRLNDNPEDVEALTDFVEVARIRFSMSVNRLERSVDVDFIKKNCAILLEESFVPGGWMAELNKPDHHLRTHEAIRFFNLYFSATRGIQAKLSRKSFTVSVSISAVDEKRIAWWLAVDKDRLSEQQKEPESIESLKRTLSGNSESANAFNLPMRVMVQVMGLSKHMHDNQGLRERADDLILVRKGKKSSQPRGKELEAALSEMLPVSGNPKHLNELKHALLTGAPELKNASLLLKGDFSQHVSFKVDSNGRLSLQKAQVCPAEKWDVWVAQPLGFSVNVLSDMIGGEVFEFKNRVIGFDLGETGISYAVFDMDNQEEPIDSGAIRITNLARLAKSVRTSRKMRQGRQRFGSNYPVKLEKMREAALGECRFVIDSLINHYQAVPVFERSVPNLESGRKQIEVVYKTLLQYYLYSSTQAHKREREGYWMGANVWRHEKIKAKKESRNNENKAAKRSKKKKDEGVLLGPGIGINPRGTSQTCSHCNRNVIGALYDLKDRKGGSFKVKANGGVFSIDGIGHVRPMQRADDKWLRNNVEALINHAQEVHRQGGMTTLQLESLRKSADPVTKWRRMGFTAPYIKPMEDGEYTLEQVIRLVKSSYRRPPLMKRSKDTKQSVFCCPSCGYQMHADENAAINIGRRFFEEYVVA